MIFLNHMEKVPKNLVIRIVHQVKGEIAGSTVDIAESEFDPNVLFLTFEYFRKKNIEIRHPPFLMTHSCYKTLTEINSIKENQVLHCKIENFCQNLRIFGK